MLDYYNILGVEKTASQDDIKRAYRKLASQHHPDRGGDTAKFQEIQAAYDVLGSPEKKSQYDNPRSHYENFNFDEGVPAGFEDILSAFGNFGGMFRRTQPQQNSSLNLRTEISLEEAYSGKDLVVSIKLPSGKDQLLEIKIPKGTSSGMKLRLAGMGDDSIPNLPRGDIYLNVQVARHPKFHREGDDLIQRININAIDAMVGSVYHIDTIDKKILEVTINPGTQYGQLLALNGYGMPNIKNPSVFGRLLLEVNIVIPTNLTDDQIELLKTLQQ